MPAHPHTLPGLLRDWARDTPNRRAFTFVSHPAYDSRGVHRTLTWQRLDLRTRAVAARIAASTAPGTGSRCSARRARTSSSASWPR